MYNSILFIDFETTGLSPEKNHVTEVAVLKESLKDGSGEVLNTLVKLPEGIEIPKFITDLTGLTTEKVNKEGNLLSHVESTLKNMIDDDTLVIAHNANFDLGFLYYHFEIAPKYFMCTRTIEFITQPNKTSSLEPTYERYYGEFKQKHRALSDVYMAKRVFEAQSKIHKKDINAFLNAVAITPDRDLVFEPHNARVLDFTKGKTNA